MLQNRMSKCSAPKVLEKLWLGFHSVMKWHNPDPGRKYSNNEINAPRSFEAQTKIGWDKMLLGFILTEWGRVKNSRDHGNKWTVSLYKKAYVID